MHFNGLTGKIGNRCEDCQLSINHYNVKGNFPFLLTWNSSEKYILKFDDKEGKKKSLYHVRNESVSWSATYLVRGGWGQRLSILTSPFTHLLSFYYLKSLYVLLLAKKANVKNRAQQMASKHT